MSRAVFFRGPICRGPICQRANSSSSPSRCVKNVGGKVNNGCSATRDTDIGQSDPVFRTATYVRTAKASLNSEKVLGSTLVASPDIGPFTVPTCNSFDLLSAPEAYQDTSYSGSLEVESNNSNQSYEELPSTHTEVSTQVPVHPITAECLEQHGGQFGCFPLTYMHLSIGPKVVWQTVSDITQAHHLIRSSGVPNFPSQ